MSRFRSIAPAVGMILVLAACTGQSATPSPAASAAAPSAPARRPSPPRPSRAGSAEAPSQAAACATDGKFKGVNVNILTFNGPQVAEPLQRRAPDWEQPDRRPRQRRRGRLPDDLRQGPARRVDRHQRLRRLRLQPAVAGRLRRPGLPARPDRSREQRSPARLAGHRPVLPGLQRDLQRQGLHDPARRRLPHGLLPQGPPRQGRRRAAGDLGRLPHDRRRSTTARTSTATASRTTARASPRRRAPRATGGSSRSPPACSRARAPNDGAFFDTSNMNPLFGPNEAMTKALETYAKTATFGPPDELNMDVGGTARPVHDRALRPDDGLGRHRDPDARARTPRTRPARRSRRAGSRSSTASTGKLVAVRRDHLPERRRRRELRPVRLVRRLVRRGQRRVARRRTRTPRTTSCRT